MELSELQPVFGPFFIVAAAVVTLMAASGCSSGSASGAAEPSPTPTMPSVRTVFANQGTIHPALTIPGSIAPHQVAALSNAISEPALHVYVQEGDRVKIGQVLAQLDVDDLQANLQAAERTARADSARTQQTQFSASLSYAQAPAQDQQAKAQLTQAQLTLREATRNLSRNAQLVAQGYLPQQNYDEQEVVVANDQQAVYAAAAAQQSAAANVRVIGNGTSGLQAATIAQAREDAAAAYATAEQLRRQIARAHIVSPVDGVVINRNLNPGEYPAGRQIFTIESDAQMYAILTASAVQAYQIRTGERVAIVRAGLPSGRFFGNVSAVLDAATAGSTNFTVKVSVPNERGGLRAGTPVQAMVALQPVRGLTVPASAFIDDARTRIITVANHRARTVHVTELATDGATSIVSGIAPGTQIVRDGSAGVSDGQSVETAR